MEDTLPDPTVTPVTVAIGVVVEIYQLHTYVPGTVQGLFIGIHLPPAVRVKNPH